MANSFESNILRLLQATQEQRATFVGEAKRIAQRCRSGHSTDSTTTTNGTDGSKATNGEDVEMTDADANGAAKELIKDEWPTKTNGSSNGKKASQEDTKAAFFCRSCYSDFLTMVHQTYAAPAQTQWYSAQRVTFLAELDQRLDDVRGLRAPLSSVDKWITARKQAWLRSQLQEAFALQTLGDILEGEKAEFQAKMADPATDLSELLRVVVVKAGSNAASGGGGDRERIVDDVQTATKKLQQTANNSERSIIYRDNLFPRGVPDLPAVLAIEKKMLDGTVGLDEGLGEVMRDLNGGDEDTRAAKIEKHRKRLAELRRAKAAHEAQKLKKMKPVDVPYFLQDDTPCATCGKASDPQKSPFCKVCFLEVDYCLRENQTVWCSTSCMKEDYARHFAANHPCAAGDRCARSKPEPDIARQEPRYYFCRECVLSFSIGTVYCNDRCAGRDFQRHREKVHLPNREMRADNHDDRSDLSYSSFAKVDYTAADITKHLMSIEEAFSSCQKKHPDWKLTETKVQLTLPWPTRSAASGAEAASDK